MAQQGTAVVIGATGGIGEALLRALQADGNYERIVGLSRRGDGPRLEGVELGRIDVTDEASIAAAAIPLEAAPPLRLVVVATGVLQAAGMAPEKTFRTLDGAAMLQSFRVNTVGPALVGKHLLPLLPRCGRSVFAALSARVGSIGDNRLGGWHSYRAAKAALNMVLRNFAIELAQSRPEAICVGLHPGTVRTALSAPFAGRRTVLEPAAAAGHLLEVIARLTVAESGSVLAWDGARIMP